MDSISLDDNTCIMGDFNAHVGQSRNGYEDELGPHREGGGNIDAEPLLDMCLRIKLEITNN